MESIGKGKYLIDENALDASYENMLTEIPKLKGKALVRVKGYKSQKYYDAVSRLRKKSQQKVNELQKVLPSVQATVPR
jgi:hypothetical protein